MATYNYRDAQGNNLTVDIVENPNGTAQVYLSARDMRTLANEMLMATVPALANNGMVVVSMGPVVIPTPQSPAPPQAVVAQAPVQNPLGPKLLLSKSRTDLALGTPVVWTNEARQYVRPAVDEEPIGRVVKCEAGFIDWYVDVDPV